MSQDGISFYTTSFRQVLQAAHHCNSVRADHLITFQSMSCYSMLTLEQIVVLVTLNTDRNVRCWLGWLYSLHRGGVKGMRGEALGRGRRGEQVRVRRDGGVSRVRWVGQTR